MRWVGWGKWLGTAHPVRFLPVTVVWEKEWVRVQEDAALQREQSWRLLSSSGARPFSIQLDLARSQNHCLASLMRCFQNITIVQTYLILL